MSDEEFAEEYSYRQYLLPVKAEKFEIKTDIGEDVADKIKNDEVVTVNDPCCGGGGMLMAALDVLKNEYGINYTRNCFRK